jgi:hypothetical protein
MLYEYNDEFLKVEDSELEKKESEAIEEVEKLGVSDEFLKKKLVVAKVYMMLAAEKLENETFLNKYKIYKEEFENYLSLAKTENYDRVVSSVEIGRG